MDIVSVQKKEKKDLDAKKEKPMGDAKSEKRKGKNCDSLNDLAKDYEVSRKTESINQSQKVADITNEANESKTNDKKEVSEERKAQELIREEGKTEKKKKEKMNSVPIDKRGKNGENKENFLHKNDKKERFRKEFLNKIINELEKYIPNQENDIQNKDILEFENLSQDRKHIFEEKYKLILDDVGTSILNGNIPIRGDSNQKAVVGSLIYLLSRTSIGLKKPSFTEIARSIDHEDSSMQYSIKYFYYQNFCEKYNSFLEVSRENFLTKFIEDFAFTDSDRKFVFELLKYSKNQLQDVNNKSIAEAVAFIAAKACNDIDVNTSIFSGYMYYSDLVKEITRNFIINYDMKENPKAFQIDILELNLLALYNNFQKVDFCVRYIGKKLSLPKNSINFSIELVKRFNNQSKIESKAVKSLSGISLYLGAVFYNNNLETYKRLNYLEKITKEMKINKDRARNHLSEFKNIYKELAFELVNKRIEDRTKEISLSDLSIAKAKILVRRAHKKWWHSNHRYMFNVSIADVAIYLGNILTDEGMSYLTHNEIHSHPFFEEKFRFFGKIINNRDFLKLMVRIHKVEVIPVLSSQNKNYPLKEDLFNLFPIYGQIINVRRKYKGFTNTIYYEDILMEIGLERPINQGNINFFHFRNHLQPEINVDNNTCLPKDLESHLKIVAKNGDFPDDIIKLSMEKPDLVSRISTFKVRGVRYKQRLNFEGFLQKKGLIKIHDHDYSLCKLACPENYRNSDILGHGGPSHEMVLPFILKNNKKSIGIEVPIWMQYNDKYLTGHPDLIQVRSDGTIIVADYKPQSFFHALPQICYYGIVMKKKYKIKNLKCVAFNQYRAWEFDPELILKEINNYLDTIGKNYNWKTYDLLN